MCGFSILLLVVVTPQQAQKADAELDRAKRAAIVDRIMAEPAPPRLKRPAPVEVPVEQPAPPPPVLMRVQQNRKRMTLEPKEIAPAEDGEEGQPAPQAMPINIREMALAQDNFDRWVFGEVAGEEKWRAHLDLLLSVKIGHAVHQRRIDPAQLRKLRLAGSGDIKRFFDRVEESRREFEVARKDFNAGRMALNQLEPLSAEFQEGPFGGDSFFEKALRKIENEATAARREGK